MDNFRGARPWFLPELLDEGNGLLDEGNGLLDEGNGLLDEGNGFLFYKIVNFEREITILILQNQKWSIAPIMGLTVHLNKIAKQRVARIV